MTLYARSLRLHPAKSSRSLSPGLALPLALVLALGFALSLNLAPAFDLPNEAVSQEAGAGMDPDGRWIAPAASSVALSAEAFPAERFPSAGEAGAGMDPDGRWSGPKPPFGQPGDAGAGMDPDGRQPLNWG